jgi:hypothetical protein
MQIAVSRPGNASAVVGNDDFGRIFICHQCCSKRRIAGYVTIATVLMTDKKTNKDG